MAMRQMFLGAVGIGLALSVAGIARAESPAMGAPLQFSGKIANIDRASRKISVDPGALRMAKEFHIDEHAKVQAAPGSAAPADSNKDVWSLQKGDEVQVTYTEDARHQAVVQQITLLQPKEAPTSPSNY